MNANDDSALDDNPMLNALTDFDLGIILIIDAANKKLELERFERKYR